MSKETTTMVTMMMMRTRRRGRTRRKTGAERNPTLRMTCPSTPIARCTRVRRGRAVVTQRKAMEGVENEGGQRRQR